MGLRHRLRPRVNLGFAVPDLLPRARNGRSLKIGLVKLAKGDWLQPDPDPAARRQAFLDYPDGVQLTAGAQAPGKELALLLGIAGGLPEAAAARHEDMCLLTRSGREDVYRLVGAAVAWPSDWIPAEKIGRPMRRLHAPIHGYAEQLATGVDRFMAKLKPGAIYGRSNWFIAPTGAGRWNAAEAGGFGHVDAKNAGQTLFARCERQTLRRLPETGAILFTIGIYTSPLGDLPPECAGWLARAASAIPPGERERRGIGHYLPALQTYAAARAKEKAV